MEEEWRDIAGYEGLYKVSNLGRVKSLGNGNSNNSNNCKERILKAGKNSRGYLQVHLCKNGKYKTYKIHRLVAIVFIPNPNNLPQVNHKDENKENNYVENLEWCDRKYNVNYGTRNKRVTEKLRGRKHSEEHNKKVAEKLTNNPKTSKPVIGISKVSGLITEYPSIMEAERVTGVSCGHIVHCCKGNRKSAGGYIWQYAE